MMAAGVALPPWGAVWALHALAVGAWVCDWQKAAGLEDRVWFLALPFMALLERAGAGPKHCWGLALVALLWLVLAGFEKVFRFGLFDAPGVTPGVDARRSGAECAAPPCALAAGVAVYDFAVAVLALGVQYWAVRSYAAAVRDAEAASQRCVGLLLHIAALELDAAGDALDDGGGAELPFAVECAFAHCLDELRVLRPFLPESVLAAHAAGGRPGRESRASEGGAAQQLIAPGSDTGEAALCFTDIVGSSALWEEAPDAMLSALKTHNSAIRGAIIDTGGYEVKIIGDCFMVAFRAVAAAAKFGLTVHERLLDAPWPRDLLDLPQCRRDRSGLWGGLVVRIGINAGTVSVENNEVSGRYDYFGGAVNVAARAESAAPAGGVAITAAAYEELEKRQGSDEGWYTAYSVGAVKLKGIKDEVEMYILHSQRLAGRKTPRQFSAVSTALSDVSWNTQDSGEANLDAAADPERLCRAVSVQSRVSSVRGIGKDAAGVSKRQLMRRKLSNLSSCSSFVGSVSGVRAAQWVEHSRQRRSYVSGSSFGGPLHPTIKTPTHTPLRPIPSMSVAQVYVRVPYSGPGGGGRAVTAVMNEALDRVIAVAGQTSGQLQSVNGSSFTVTWNVKDSCPLHRSTSMLFVKKLVMLLREQDVGVHVGVSAGGAYEGTLGAGSMKFITIVGGCIKLAQLLCEEATAQHVHCLAASLEAPLWGVMKVSRRAATKVAVWNVSVDAGTNLPASQPSSTLTAGDKNDHAEHADNVQECSLLSASVTSKADSTWGDCEAGERENEGVVIYEVNAWAIEKGDKYEALLNPRGSPVSDDGGEGEGGGDPDGALLMQPLSASSLLDQRSSRLFARTTAAQRTTRAGSNSSHVSIASHQSLSSAVSASLTVPSMTGRPRSPSKNRAASRQTSQSALPPLAPFSPAALPCSPTETASPSSADAHGEPRYGSRTLNF
eukprot:TRINITY_DN27427_c0_g1_i1.p1 TRINITY_DN27427_c0_g1~~TRINITY_DN27427_c0_g1_i1.p1  ORF type:complete len:965 (+),score=251.76 TRINITY_DN27427_c0_g1_i1:53-2896(+)